MKTKRSFWPYAIILYFIVFVAAMASWVVFAVRQDQELVRKDYYEQELKYQGELDKAIRAADLTVKLTYDSGDQTLAIELPSAPSSGSIYFYRPASAKLDREIFLASKAAQKIDLKSFQSGLWKIRLSWTVDGEDFRRDQTLLL